MLMRNILVLLAIVVAVPLSISLYRYLFAPCPAFYDKPLDLVPERCIEEYLNLWHQIDENPIFEDGPAMEGKG